jgi:hypothetical protein
MRRLEIQPTQGSSAAALMAKLINEYGIAATVNGRGYKLEIPDCPDSEFDRVLANALEARNYELIEREDPNPKRTRIVVERRPELA